MVEMDIFTMIGKIGQVNLQVLAQLEMLPSIAQGLALLSIFLISDKLEIGRRNDKQWRQPHVQLFRILFSNGA